MLHLSQRDLVTASLASTHHPDVYLSRGSNARPAPSVECPPESTRGEARSTGRDGGLPAPTRPCPRCTRGTWRDTNGRPYRCNTCGGTGQVPADATDGDLRGRVVPRPIPGTDGHRSS